MADTALKPDSKALDATLQALQDLLGDRVSTASAVREHHGHDESYHHSSLPDAVCFAHTTEEVSEIVKICAANDVPIIAYGTGTSLEGHVIPTRGGITVDLSQMDAVVEVNPEDLDCTVQAGVRRKQLNEYLRDTGLFFPIDPGADASLGGMAATRASGTNAVRYGTMRENVLALTCVMADGRIIRTNRRARKSSAGYDLTRLMVGSEGTLGIITEVTLKLYGIPEAMTSAVVSFPELEGAVNAVIATIQCPHRAAGRCADGCDQSPFRPRLPGDVHPVPGIPRVRVQRGRAGQQHGRYLCRVRRCQLPVDRAGGGAHEAVAGPA